MRLWTTALRAQESGPSDRARQCVGLIVLATLVLTVLSTLVITPAFGGHVSAAGTDDRTQSAPHLPPSSVARVPDVDRSVESLERMRGDEAHARVAAEDSEDLLRRLMLFRIVVEGRGLR